MKVLMLAEDPTICMAGSGARKRMEAYAELFEELHVVVLTCPGFESEKKGNLFLYPITTRNPLHQRWRMYTQARTLAATLRFDVVSAQGPNEIGFLAYRIARRFGIRLQLQVHTDVLSPWYRRASKKEYVRFLLARYLLPRADCVRVVSKRIKHSLVSQLGIPESRIFILPIFADVRLFQDARPLPADSARLKEYTYKMIAVGRFVDREKNFSMLIKMMHELVKREPRAVLAIVGDGPDRENYKLQVKKYKLERNIILEPWRDDLASFYQCFDVLLVSSWYEGWGRVAIEAMAAGLPVVMTDVGLAGEVVQNGYNGRVVPVGDIRTFLEACVDLCASPEKQCALAGAAKDTIAHMHPQNEAQYLECYRKSFEQCI